MDLICPLFATMLVVCVIAYVARYSNPVWLVLGLIRVLVGTGCLGLALKDRPDQKPSTWCHVALP